MVNSKQEEWLKPYVSRKTRKGGATSKEHLQIFNKLLFDSSYGNTMEYVRNRLLSNLAKTDDAEEWYKQQKKALVIVTKPFENFDCLAFKFQTVTIKNSSYSELCIITSSKLHT